MILRGYKEQRMKVSLYPFSYVGLVNFLTSLMPGCLQ